MERRGYRKTLEGEGVIFKCIRMLLAGLFMPISMYRSDTLAWKEKERSRVRVLQEDNLRT